MGYVFLLLYRELYAIASGGWGAGNTSLALLVFGPLAIGDFISWLPPTWDMASFCAIPLYAALTLLLWRAKDGSRQKALGAAAYLSWCVLAFGAAAWLGSRIGVFFYEREGQGLRMLGQLAPALTVTLGTGLLAWHAFAWYCLLRSRNTGMVNAKPARPATGHVSSRCE